MDRTTLQWGFWGRGGRTEKMRTGMGREGWICLHTSMPGVGLGCAVLCSPFKQQHLWLGVMRGTLFYGGEESNTLNQQL